MSNFNKSLCDLLKARFSIIYIPTFEENRLIDTIDKIVKNENEIKTVRTVYIWTVTNGFVPGPSDASVKSSGDTKDPMKALNFIEKCEDNAVFILKDFHVFFGIDNRAPELNLIRKLRDLSPVLKSSKNPKSIIITAPREILPFELQKEITILEFCLPGYEDIMEVLNEIIEANKATGKIEINMNEYIKDKIVKAAQGLTLQEAENAFARAMVEDGKFDINDVDVIFEEKRQIVRKTGLLEFVNTPVSIEDVGGLGNLKKWLKKRNNSWLDKAREYNLPLPKGVLITGVPGCGKSLVAKAISSMWKLPLLRLDMGKVFQGIVGSSEENMRKAINTAEAVSPSILWIDEIEKGFAGTSSSGDSGTTARIFGTFLTWMQEKTNPVFVIATANNINVLPPEFLRKGRFDEIFFVDIPTIKEREDIFLLHMVKLLKNSKARGNFKLSKEFVKKLAEITEGYVGAEIEQVVVAAVFEAFSEDRHVEYEDFIKSIKNTVPLSVTMAEEILRLRNWANVRAVSATAKEDQVEYIHTKENSDEKKNDDMAEGVYNSRGGRTVDI
ncbi:MAG: AAA family ATPase [Candidatus Muiribacteriota bacterium]